MPRYRAPDLKNADILAVIQASAAPMTRDQIGTAMGLREITTNSALAVRLRALAEQGCVTAWKEKRVVVGHGGRGVGVAVMVYAASGTPAPAPVRKDIDYPVAVLGACNAIQKTGLYPSIERIRARIGGDCRRITDARDALLESGALVLTTEPARPGRKLDTADEEPERDAHGHDAEERARRVREYATQARFNGSIPYHQRPRDDRRD